MSAYENSSVPANNLTNPACANSSEPEGELAEKIKIDKTAIAREGDGALVEVFTMSLGAETILLLPHKNWTQLDTFKWRARCILPRVPAGLEINWENLKVAGRTISPWESDACEKLEQVFNEWLATERTIAQTPKQQPEAAPGQASQPQPEEDPVHFQLDLSNAAQPRLKCLEGDKVMKVVALNAQGLNALIEQGLLRRPKTMKVGALHNWVELDGRMFRFKDDPNEAQQLEKALNEQYLIAGDPDAPQDVHVFANPASPTGFDIQFPAAPLGVAENRKQHLKAETIQLLQDPERCHVLRKDLTARLAPPDLVFKLKTPGGGERYLDHGPGTELSIPDENGQLRTIDLSQPISLLNLGVRELNAIFNHPAVNRRARLAQLARTSKETQRKAA